MALSPQELEIKVREISARFSLCRACEAFTYCQIASAWLAADNAARQTLNSQDNFQNCPGKNQIIESTSTNTEQT